MKLSNLSDKISQQAYSETLGIINTTVFTHLNVKLEVIIMDIYVTLNFEYFC